MENRELEKYIESLEQIIVRKEKIIKAMKDRAMLGDLSQCVAHSMEDPLYYLRNDTNRLSAELKEILGTELSKKYTTSENIRNLITQRDRLTRLLASLEYYNNLIAELLDSLQTGSWTCPVDKGNISMNKVIVRWAEDIKCHPHFDTSVKITLQLNPSIPELQMRECEAFQIVNNLALNSLEAMEKSEKRELYIRTDVTANLLILEISDTGCGIPGEIKEKVFKPFYSTKWFPAKADTHSGLGLYTVSRIIEAYGGKIEFESEPQKDTTFRVSFPSGESPKLIGQGLESQKMEK